MSIRAIPRTAIGGSIKAMRLPLDIAVSLLPGNGAGPRPTAGLALDRIEAHVRDLAGVALGDEVLREDAARRRVAADERERALRLRRAAQADAEQRKAAADLQRRTQESAAEAAERAAEQERAAAAKEAAVLQQEARRAEATAEAIDPEER